MKNKVIKKRIAVNASPNQVWRVFTDPAITRQMGGEYVSDWKTGSSFGWKGKDGKMFTKGTILQIEADRLLKHNLVDLQTGDLLSVITYELKGEANNTVIIASEELHYEMTDDQCKAASEGWDLALKAVKEIAEKL
jgi:uncharacterized protein YndB with AHSA1/START domain